MTTSATSAAARLPCPRCNEGLTATEIRSLNAKLNSSLIVKRSGGKVWRKHLAGYSRCRCKKCNSARARRIHLR